MEFSRVGSISRSSDTVTEYVMVRYRRSLTTGKPVGDVRVTLQDALLKSQGTSVTDHNDATVAPLIEAACKARSGQSAATVKPQAQGATVRA